MDWTQVGRWLTGFSQQLQLQTLLLSFVPVFVAMDAVGTLPIFIGLTRELERAEKGRIIRHSILTALVVGWAFMVAGRQLFGFLGITVGDFKVAGGALLFVLSLSDLLQTTPKQRRRPAATATVGVVPLGIPLIVGPAVLTTLIILMDSAGLWVTSLAFLLNVLLVWLVFSLSEWLLRLLGHSGATALSKVSSVLLAAIGVMMLRKGFEEILATWGR